MIERWCDTSALLHQPSLLFPQKELAISPLTLSELEHIKGSENYSQEIKYYAREAVRQIMTEHNFEVVISNNKRVDKLIKSFPFLSPTINDHRILCEAELYARDHEQTIMFLTSDALQYLFANELPHLEAIYPMGEELAKRKSDSWCGWSKYFPTEKELTLLYADPKINSLGCKTNEFAEVYDGKDLKDVLFWDGHEYKHLKYKDMKNPYLDEVIKPKNLEQKMAFHLLQNPNIKVKLLTSAWGSGKTLLALTYALEKVYRGDYAKLVFVRNNIIVADTNDIGFLPGELHNKMSIWGAPIADHLGGQEVLDQLIDDGIIEIYPLSHMRGRSIKNSVVICDECENMNDKLVTLLMSRIEESSELIFCGDVAQIDNRKFEKSNGIKSMLNNLAGHPLFGTVKLLKSERGAVSAMCDLMRPPV